MTVVLLRLLFFMFYIVFFSFSLFVTCSTHSYCEVQIKIFLFYSILFYVYKLCQLLRAY